MQIKIDNGNHIVFSANNNFIDFCKKIKSDHLIKEIAPNFLFFDSKNKIKWNLNLAGVLFNFLKNKEDRIPNANIFVYLEILKFLIFKKSATVYDLVGKSKIYKTFWEPLTIGVMNTSPKKASATLLSNVLKQTIFKGPKKCVILQPLENWDETLIKKAQEKIRCDGGKIFFSNILKKINLDDNGNVNELIFIKKKIKVLKDDRVILAIPPTNLMKFINHLNLPVNYNTILNIHFDVYSKDINFFTKPIVGFINSTSDWMFVKKNHLSITISDANKYNDIDSQKIADKVWKEVCMTIGKRIKFKNFQIIREKKATYVQSPSNVKLIKNINNIPKNLILAGDWTQHNLPCTIEASIISGKRAVE